MPISLDKLMEPYLYDVVTNLNEANFFNKVVGFDNNASRVASGEASFIFSGPPVLFPRAGSWKSGANSISANSLGGIAKYLFPIGAVSQFQLQKGSNIIPFQELGSHLKRHARGSGQYSASMVQTLCIGSNLKYACYGWLPSFMEGEYGDTSLSLGLIPSPSYDKAVAQGRPWEHFQWVGFESDIYKVPFGLLALTGSPDGRAIHVEYLERCFIPQHSRSIQAGNPMISSSVQIYVTRPRAFADSNNNSLIPSNVFLKKSGADAIYKLQDFRATAGLSESRAA